VKNNKVLSIILLLCFCIADVIAMVDDLMQEVQLSRFKNSEEIRIWVREEDISKIEKYRQIDTSKIGDFTFWTTLLYVVNRIHIEVGEKSVSHLIILDRMKISPSVLETKEEKHKFITQQLMRGDIDKASFLVLMSITYFDFVQIPTSSERSVKFIVTRNHLFPKGYVDHLDTLIRLTR